MKKEIKYDRNILKYIYALITGLSKGPLGAEQALIAKYIQNNISRQVG